MAAAGEVAEVVLMLVGFLFETDVAIGFHAVAVLHEQHEPLDAVPEEEGQVEQFALLRCMDEFVIEFRLVERTDREDEAKQTDGQEALSKKNTLHRIDSMLLHFLNPLTFSLSCQRIRLSDVAHLSVLLRRHTGMGLEVAREGSLLLEPNLSAYLLDAELWMMA